MHTEAIHSRSDSGESASLGAAGADGPPSRKMAGPPFFVRFDLTKWHVMR